MQDQPTTRAIPLSQGLWAIVDASDYDWLSAVTWSATSGGTAKTFYAVRGVGHRGHQTLLKMHRVILGVADGVHVDHVDLNGLNNTRANLRIATRSDNQCNRGLQSNSTSGYKGVSLNRRYGNWDARIMVRGKQHCLGTYSNPVDAARAYDAAALRLHGEFARLNFP